MGVEGVNNARMEVSGWDYWENGGRVEMRAIVSPCQFDKPASRVEEFKYLIQSLLKALQELRVRAITQAHQNYARTGPGNAQRNKVAILRDDDGVTASGKLPYLAVLESTQIDPDEVIAVMPFRSKKI